MYITSRFTGRWKPKDGDSVTILSAPIRYKKDSQGTVPPAASANWQSSIPSDMSAGDFLWTWTRVNYSDGTHTDSYCVSKWGENGDNNYSIYKTAFEKPGTPTGETDGWDSQPEALDITEFVHIGDWYPQKDGFHRAPYIADSQHTIQTLQFVTTKADQYIYLHVKVNSESNYDVLYVGNVDEEPPTIRQASAARYNAMLTGSNKEAYVKIKVSTTGAHTIGICYCKDASQTVSNEYAMYRVGVPAIWESHVLTWNGATPLTWSSPCEFSLGRDSMRQDNERQNLLRMAGFPSEEQIGSWWNTHNGSIQFNGYEGHNVFYSTHNDANNYKEILRQDVYKTGVDTLKTNKWYTLSFVCKGVGTLNTYFYPSSTGHVLTAAGVYIDDVFHTPAETDMVASFTLTTEYTRHKVTFKTSASFSGKVMLLFRLLAGTNKEVYITCPKLEESSMYTNFNLSYGDIQAMVIGEDGFPDECGVYDPTRQYVWDDVKRQYVYYQIDGQYRSFFVRRKGMTVPVNTPPTSGGNTYWEQGSTDVSTLLANTIIGANVKIGGFLASMNLFKSQNERIEIDGQNNIIKVLNAAKTAIIAAMGNVNYPFFAGGTQGDNAVWSVDDEGKMKAQAGQFGDLMIVGDGGSNFKSYRGVIKFQNDQHAYTWIYTDISSQNGNDNIDVFNDTGGSCIRAYVPAGTQGNPPAIYALGSLAIEAEGKIKANSGFIGSGNGLLNGMVEGYKYARKVFSGSAGGSMMYDLDTEIAKSNRLLVGSYNSSGTILVAMPRLSAVLGVLGLTSSSSFAIRLTIIGDVGSYNGYSARQWLLNGRGSSYNLDELPLILDQNGDVIRQIGVDPGDIVDFLLVYDPNRTDTVSGYPMKYTARKLIILE